MNETYVHRWSGIEQHEFTLTDQPDLQNWSDMLTINRYLDVDNDAGLKRAHNQVLATYLVNAGLVVRTDFIPPTEEKKAGYLIVVAFPRKEFIECVFARFELVKKNRVLGHLFTPPLRRAGAQQRQHMV